MRAGLAVNGSTLRDAALAMAFLVAGLALFQSIATTRRPPVVAAAEPAPRSYLARSSVAGAKVLGVKRLSEHEVLTELFLPSPGLPGKDEFGTTCYVYSREDLGAVKVICPDPFATVTD